MIDFRDKYIQDAGDLIQTLEEQLINFEKQPENLEIIKEIFRVMHTLKGSAGMFGFKRIENLTHSMEDLYDLLRNQKLKITTTIIDKTFKSVDIIKGLLNNNETLDNDLEIILNDLYNFFKFNDINLQSNEVSTSIISKKENELNLFYILYKPEKNILQRGVKPFKIFGELDSLGKYLKFEFETDIEISENNILNFNLYWEIIISGDIVEADLFDVFLFFTENEFSINNLTHLKNKDLDFFLSNLECLKSNKITLTDLKDKINVIFPIVIEKKIELKTDSKSKTEPIGYQEETIRVPISKLENLLTLVSDLITVNYQINFQAKQLDNSILTKSVKELTKISKNFKDEIFSIRLIPLQSIIINLQRLVRDLSLKFGKKIKFITEGMNTELDKSIIQKLEGPLIHLIRNCIDHGLEIPEERIGKNKNENGCIKLIAYHSGANVFIQIHDDGKGIDKELILKKAIHQNLVKDGEILSEIQIFDLIFTPGFSTSESVSEISGRGVGLDVVKKEITELHGEIFTESKKDIGTSFTLKLPLSLVIIDSLLVQSQKYKFLIPLNNIIACKSVNLQNSSSNQMTFEYLNKIIPIIRIKDFFKLNDKIHSNEKLIVISITGKLYGLIVDTILHSMQTVVKPLGYFHHFQEYFAGVCILSDGELGYILELNNIIRLNKVNQNE